MTTKENATAVGVPAKVVKVNGKKVGQMDQVHVPNPISNELRQLQAEVKRLRKKLDQLDRLEAGHNSEKHDCD